MESLNQKTSDPKKLLCIVRNTWVAATPEERLRQSVLQYMVGKGGYPRSLIALETSIEKTARRADIISYYKPPEGGLSPLIVIECKAIKLTSAMLQQIGGYNYFFQAPFIALSAPSASYWGWLDRKEKRYKMQYGFPDYAQLMTEFQVHFG